MLESAGEALLGRFEAPALGQFPRYVARNRTDRTITVFIRSLITSDDTKKHCVFSLPGMTTNPTK